MNFEAEKWAKESYGHEADSILATGKNMDWEAFGKAVEALKNAARIGTTGCGHTGISMQHFAHLMCCIERPARFISPAEAVHGASGFIHEGDVIVLASRGGKTKELIPILEICKKKNAIAICITEKVGSPLAVGSDIVLPITITRETDKYNAQGTSSFAVTNAVADALQAALIEETGYLNEQFALIHPGGAVGERLNKK